MLTVVEIGLETVADDKTLVLIDRDLAKIKEAVDIRAQQQAVGGLVDASGGVCMNMGCIEIAETLFGLRKPTGGLHKAVRFS